ncbi:MAG: hypothetical protein K0U37_06265 [Gammaproteobacteria bacterium]|nr:hypothetical protein [Gammaproteobacteria bacterium]
MLEGLVLGGLFYGLALLIVIGLVNCYTPLTNRLFGVILLCFVGHYVGCYAYSLFQSDSYHTFFLKATPVYYGSSTSFILNMVWYVRAWFTGESYLGTLFFFSAFSFVGHILWYLVFVHLAKTLKINYQPYLFPALILMCWPSFLFFTAGIGKDSLSFFLIPSVLLTWNQLIYGKSKKGLMFVCLVLAVCLMTMVRPYLLMIIGGACYASTFNGLKRLSFFRLLSLIVLAPLLLYAVHWVITTQGGMENTDATDIMNRAYKQQELLNGGTSFPMLSKNPVIVFLSLPYSFMMNLIMPLFVFAHNLEALLASFENLFLINMIYRFWKNRRQWRFVKSQVDFAKLCFYTFMFGMAFLGLVNTNLGLAMRQKGMYLPAFIVLALVMQLHNKRLKHESRVAYNQASAEAT